MNTQHVYWETILYYIYQSVQTRFIYALTVLLFVISDSPQKDSRLVTTTRSKHNCASHIRYNRLLDSKDLSQEKNLCFSGTNQKPERRRPFGTGLVKHCAQGLFWPFFTFLRAIFFRPFRLSLAPNHLPLGLRGWANIKFRTRHYIFCRNKAFNENKNSIIFKSRV